MDNPLVSVIIPTKNSSEFIARVLDNLENQTYTNIEVIVVDNYSTDNTRKIAHIYTDKVYLKGPERATQDNYGISKAKGEIIYLTGSDMTRDYDYIEQGVSKIKEGYDAIYASVLTDIDVRHFWGNVKALERLCYIGDNTIESARFFKKSVWEKLGGYDETLIQIEEDFQHRLNRATFKTGRISAREYHLHEEKNLGAIFKKSHYYGQFMGNYCRKHKGRGLRQLQPFRNFKPFLKHPVLLGGLIIYKVVQYTGGLYGMFNKQNCSSNR